MMGKYAWLRLCLNWPLVLGAYGAFVGFTMVAQHPIQGIPGPGAMDLLDHGFGLGFAIVCCIVAGVGGGQKVSEMLKRRKVPA